MKKFLTVKSMIDWFEEEYSEEMEILKLGKVHPLSGKVQNLYDPNTTFDYYGNVGDHCLRVACCAWVLATSVLKVDDLQIRNIVSRAIIHDANKGYELMRKFALKSGAIKDAYSLKAYEMLKSLLEKQGITGPRVDYLVNAGEETGHLSMSSFVEVSEDDGILVLKTQDLARMIVHLADDMTFTPIARPGEVVETLYLTVEERMVAAGFESRYPFLYREGFGFNDNREVVFVEDVSTEENTLHYRMSYAQWQVWVAWYISRYLANQIDAKISGKEAGGYLKRLVNDQLK